jgi:putative flippase GtrA
MAYVIRKPAVFIRVLRQFMVFTGVGAVGTLAHYLTLIALVQMIRFDAVLASSAGYIVGAFVNYTLNYYVTFQSTKSHYEAAVKFFTVAGIGFILNGAMMHWLFNGVGLHYLIAQISATATVLIWNFFGNRLWTFRESK